MTVSESKLVWPQSHEVFLARADGSYQLVPRGAEDALRAYALLEVTRFGKPDSKANLVIYGDLLPAASALIRTPDLRPRLIYLDPPFNTQEDWRTYNDALSHDTWLTMMRDRLLVLRDLLAEDGSIWVHCDDRGQAYVRVLMDELFGRESFVATVVWQRKYARDNRPAIGRAHDYLHVYSPLGKRWKEVRNRLSRRDAPGMWTNPDNDPRGEWSTHSLVAQGGHGTRAQHYTIETPSGKRVTPPRGSCWRVTEDRFAEMVAAGEISFGPRGDNVPRKKVYRSTAKGLVPSTWWPHSEVGHTQEARKEIKSLFPHADPFLTPKPERLMARILQIASNRGDLVFDGFLGSGTTAAVAQKMKRRWIGVELRPDIVNTYVIPRLTAVVDGEDAGGVTSECGWRGGGGFVVSRLVPAETGAPERSDARAA